MRRRDFLTTTTLAASGMAIPWVHAGTIRPDRVEEGDSLQVALIGVGKQGRVLLNAARQVPNLRFCALCDMWKSARSFGQKYLARYDQEVNIYADYRAMLDQETALDAVLIATPDFVHGPQATACLEKGLHVYCEPMLAHTLDAARGIVQSAARSGKLFQVGFQRRTDARYQHVRQRLLNEAQLPGTLTAVQTQWAEEAKDLRGWPRRFAIPDDELHRFGYHDMTQFRNWSWYPKYGAGPFCDHIAHQLDVCHWFLGTVPQAVLASGGNDFYPDRPHLDTVMSVFEFPRSNGDASEHRLRVSCNLFTNTSAGGMRQFERFMGTEGSVQLSENPRWMRIGREPSARDWDQWVSKGYLVKPEVVAAHSADDNATEVHVSGELELFQLPALRTEASFAPHLANFCAAIRGQAELACPPDAAWPSHVAAFKAIAAVQARKTLPLTPRDYQLS